MNNNGQREIALKNVVIKFQNYVNAIGNFIERKEVDKARQLITVLKNEQNIIKSALNELGIAPQKYDEAMINVYSIMTLADNENATQYCEDAYELDKLNTVVLNNMAYIYHKKDNNIEKSFQTYVKCLQVDPKYMPAYMGVCDLLHHNKAFEIEVQILKTGLANFPESCDLWNQLGVTLCHSHLYESVQEPLQALQQALNCAKSNIDRSKVLVNLGHLFCSLGEVKKSIELYLLAIQSDPTVRIAYQNLLLNIHYIHPKDDEAASMINNLSAISLISSDGLEAEYSTNWATAHKNYASVMYAKTLYDNAEVMDYTKTYEHSILRIGYISSDFVGHVVGMFISGFFKTHDRTKFSVYAYSNAQLGEHQIQTIPCDHYRDISGMDTAGAMRQIQTDEIDILIDLGGYTSMNRVDVMAFPIAKRMYTFLGYPNGLGMDHVKRISDVFTENKPHGVYEKEIILPQCFLNFDPIVPMARELVPSKNRDSVVFACYAKLAKITPRITKLWTMILKGVPKSRLLIKSRFFADKQFARTWFSQHFPFELFGRISLFTGGRGYLEHIHKFNYVDIHLDTYPYSGTTITTEALFYGVPSLTLCPNDAPHVSRVTGSIMKEIGLDEYIAVTEEDYVAKGIKLAREYDFENSHGRVRELFEKSTIYKPSDLTKEYEAYLLKDFTENTPQAL